MNRRYSVKHFHLNVSQENVSISDLFSETENIVADSHAHPYQLGSIP